jgi:hypothetical protein
MEAIKQFFTNSAVRTAGVMAFFAVIFIYITFQWLVEISAFAAGIAKGVLGIFIFWIFDRYAMREIDTVEELKKGNVAYALFMLSLAVVIAAAILNS